MTSIFSYTGYQTQTIRVSDNNKLVVLMTKEEKSMGEVVLRNSFEVTDGLSKCEFLMENFMGSTPNDHRCTLLRPGGPEVLFYEQTA